MMPNKIIEISNFEEEVEKIKNPLRHTVEQYIWYNSQVPLEGSYFDTKEKCLMHIKNGYLHYDEIDPKTGLIMPAFEKENNVKKWYKHGLFHRSESDPMTGLTLPAIMWSNGHHLWYIDNKVHCEDGPAMKFDDGSQVWCKNNEMHRDEIDVMTGLTLPAISYANGNKEWLQYGKHHRIDGPAKEFNDGEKNWFINGRQLFEKEFNHHPLVIAYREKKEFEKTLTNSNIAKKIKL